MLTTLLPNRSLIRVGGPDAEHLLQNIVTADLDQLAAGEAKPGALLTPQGKILFDFLISRDGADALRLDVRADVADDLVRRLMLYRLRAKAEISKQDESLVAAGWEIDSGDSQSDSTASSIESGWLRDLRFPAMNVWRGYGMPVEETASFAAYDAVRIANGVAESGRDYDLGDAFPHDVLLDQNGGVGFRKGCYVGQEVVSRMQHRGTARRRVLIVEADAALPPTRTELTANGRAIGSLGTVDGHDGLAIVRIDRVKDAVDAGTPVLAGDAPVLFTIPPGATFIFPADSSEDA